MFVSLIVHLFEWKGWYQLWVYEDVSSPSFNWYEIDIGGLSETQASCITFYWTCLFYGFYCSDVSFFKLATNLCLPEIHQTSSLSMYAHAHFCLAFFNFCILHM